MQQWMDEKEKVEDWEARRQVEAERRRAVVVDDLEEERRRCLVAVHRSAAAVAQRCLAGEEVEVWVDDVGWVDCANGPKGMGGGSGWWIGQWRR